LAERPDLDFDATPEELVSVEGDRVQLGRYQLRYEIASGGMATVYLARARGPGGFERPIAIKRIHPHLARKREFVDMFLDEARVTARIVHPNVCSVFDFGESEGAYFIAMEYLVGQSLAAVLARLSERPDLAGSTRWLGLAARIVADACEGLHAAHELKDETGAPMSVVHRDATPHNVFVTYDGAVKMVDFGVALAEGRTHQTQNRMLKGKLAYMPPEQVRGEKLDRRADIWSIGVCLWELLAVRRLFALSSDAAIVEAVARAPIAPPSAFAPAVPAKLDAIVLRALSRDVDARYPTARALGRELGVFAASVGVGTGLADLSEMMEELFASERAEKLGVVARVLGAPSLEWSNESGEHPARNGSAPSPARAAPPRAAPRALLGRLDPDEDHEEPSSRTLVHASPRAASVSGGYRAPPPASAPTTTPGLEVTKIAPVLPLEDAEASSFLVSAPISPPASTFVVAPPTPPDGAEMRPLEVATARPTPTRAWIWAGGVVGAALVMAMLVAGIGSSTTPDVRAVSLATPALPSRTITVLPPVAAPVIAAPAPDIAAPEIAPPALIAPTPEPIAAAPREPITPREQRPREERPRPSRPTPPARTDTAATGSVNVAARGGWAEIFVDGASRGRTPTRLTLPVGRQVLELRPGDGTAARRVTVVVRADTVERVVVTLAE
jgi:serine/threonine protein kinase